MKLEKIYLYAYKHNVDPYSTSNPEDLITIGRAKEFPKASVIKFELDERNQFALRTEMSFDGQNEKPCFIVKVFHKNSSIPIYKRVPLHESYDILDEMGKSLKERSHLFQATGFLRDLRCIVKIWVQTNDYIQYDVTFTIVELTDEDTIEDADFQAS